MRLICIVIFASIIAAPALADAPGNADMLLAPAEVKALTRKADAGDKEAAARLSVHYDASKSPKQAVKWLMLAAKLGDCVSVDTVVGDTSSKFAAELHKQAKGYAAQWSCKPGASKATPSVPAMY